METVNAGQLKRVIEAEHGGVSTFARSVRVHQSKGNAPGWDGLVHIFDLKDHPKAKRAYAWSSPISGGSKPRYFAVLRPPRSTNGALGAQRTGPEIPQLPRIIPWRRLLDDPGRALRPDWTCRSRDRAKEIETDGFDRFCT